MKRLSILLPVAILMTTGIAYAGPVTHDRAATVARNFYGGLPDIKGDGTLAMRNVEWQFDGIYLFTVDGGGYVMVSADDATRPILGYSAHSVIDPADLPPALEQWLAAYQRQIDILRAHNAQGYADGIAEWELLLAGTPAKDGSHNPVVGPLIATRWDQQSPYNMFCPGETVTGCAATAQAQLMKYWNHPTIGLGSHSYIHSRYGEQSADFGHTVYDWANMPNQPTQVSPYEQRAAVAQLMYHCGVSLEMNYATANEGGSAAVNYVDEPGFASSNNSLRNYFHYSPSLHSIIKMMGYTNDQWREKLTDELDLHHPILYSGQATQGGHAFVCDGYDDHGYIHFNFGWSGRGDGFFPVDSISPGVGGVGGNVTYTFNDVNVAVIGIAPVYDILLSDTIFYLGRQEWGDSLLYSTDPTDSATLSISCDADWLTLEYDAANTIGWLSMQASANESNAERSAIVTFVQGDHMRTVTIIQTPFNDDDLCPLTVIMESTNNYGWQGGANLTLQSDGGYVFGIATLDEGRLDSVAINVAPHDIYAVWNSGGGTDRYINYCIKNQYGDTLVKVNYAYANAGTHFIEWPCAHASIDNPQTASTVVYPNPTGDVLSVKADELQRVELTDLSGRLVATSTESRLDLGRLPSGTYILRVVTLGGTSVHRILKRD